MPPPTAPRGAAMSDSRRDRSVRPAAEPSPRNPLCARATVQRGPSDAQAREAAETFGPPRSFLTSLSAVLDRMEAGERLSDEDHAQVIAQLDAVRTFLNGLHHRRGGKLLGRRRAKTAREREVLALIRGRTEAST